MKSVLQKSLLEQVIANRNRYLLVALLALVTNAFLSFILIFTIGKERVVLVPPKISRSFWVGYSDASLEYLAEMSHFFISLRFNVMPENAMHQADLLLRYVSPQYFAKLKTQLLNEAKKIAKEHISIAFYPVDIKVDIKHLKTRVTGDLIAIIAGHNMPSKRMTFELAFRYNAGRLFVNSFTEVDKRV